MILIVMADASQRAALHSVLAAAGMEAVEAETAEEGLSSIREWWPDLVITEAQAGVDGLELCRRIRESHGIRETAVILLSARDDIATVRAGYEMGVEVMLPTPVDEAVLVAKASTVVDRERRARTRRHVRFGLGQRIGARYRVLQVLGRGGMGTVYLVQDTDAGERRALKALRNHPDMTAAVVTRFEREIQTLRELDHPNLIHIRDIGIDRGVRYYTMEYCPGGSLETRVDADGPLDVCDALEIAAELADGLALMHEHGILHRDIKPQNVLFTDSGTPVLTDFGIVLDIVHPRKRLTAVDQVVGTPNYMSPEQIVDPGTLDARSDVFGLGMTLFYMLCGRLPFDAGCSMETIVRIGESASLCGPAELNPAVPAAADAACRWALQKERATRCPSAAALRDRLRAVLSDLAE